MEKVKRAHLADISQQGEPAGAQDELESFKRWAEVEYSVNPNTEELNLSHIEVKASLKGWQARATRPAQTEQQPVAHRLINAEGEVMTDWHDGAPPDNFIDLCGVAMAGTRVELAFAAPIAQIAQQSAPERVSVPKLAGLKSVNHQLGIVALSFKSSEQTQEAVRELRALLASHAESRKANP